MNNMQPREKILAGVVAGLLVLLAVYVLAGRLSRQFSERHGRITALKDEIREKESVQRNGRLAAARMAEWERRSLPSDVELARTLYQNWLLSLADRAKLGNVNIDAGRGGLHRNVYYKLPFTVQGKGRLDEAIAFLHEFYGADHLHLLRELSLKPADKSGEMDFNCTIEALVLPGADRTDRLNPDRSTRLGNHTLADYTAPIVSRNIFAAYVAPRPAVASGLPLLTPPKPPSFDAARFAVLTAILEVNDAPQAWLSVKTSGQVLKLREGDKLQVGQFQGTVTRIGLSDVEIESDGKRRLLALGKSLPQAEELAAEIKPAESAAELPAAADENLSAEEDIAAEEEPGF